MQAADREFAGSRASLGAMAPIGRPTAPRMNRTAPTTSRLGRVLTAPALVYIGRISYGLYIVHHLVVFALQRHVLSVDRMPQVLGTQVLSQVVFSVIALGVSVLLAALSWHLYERPILHLKQRFPYHLPPA